MVSQKNCLIEAILMRIHNILFSIYIKENQLKLSRSAAIGFFSKELKYEFETALVNKPSVFEPLN